MANNIRRFEGGVVGGFCRHLGALKCSTWRSGAESEQTQSQSQS